MPAVIVTAWNEADRLAATLRALREAFPDARLVVADDASTDATPHVALQERAELVRAPHRLGKGGVASLAAEQVGDDDPIVLCDGDLGESAVRLRELLEPLEADEADLVVAAFARRVGGGLGLAVGLARRVLGALTGRELAAPISGQRAMRAEVLRAVTPFARGFGMETAMTIDAHRAGFRIAELELDLEHRATGRTARGFLHRGRQLAAIARVYAARRVRRRPAG